MAKTNFWFCLQGLSGSCSWAISTPCTTRHKIKTRTPNLTNLDLTAKPRVKYVILWCCQLLRLYRIADRWTNRYEALVEWNQKGKTEVHVENCTNATCSTTNTAWTGLGHCCPLYIYIHIFFWVINIFCSSITLHTHTFSIHTYTKSHCLPNT